MIPHDQMGDMSLPRIDPRDTASMMLLGHDLRASLSEVISGLRLIALEPLSPNARCQTERTTAASEALSLLLEQALMLLTQGDLQLPAALLQSDRLLEGIRRRWTPRLRDLGLQFQLLTAPDLPQHLHLNAALFERVLSNILGNAGKYATGGRVICRIGLLSKQILQISVQDEGPGFSPASLLRIQSGKGARDNPGKPGSGLGLLIVREMVEAAGGTMDVQNREGGGAVVIVSLPLALLAAPTLAASDATTRIDLSHLRILLADDSATHRSLHNQLLAKMGAEVAQASDGAAAISKIERESFDLAIIDLEMPYFNGLEVIRHIRGMSGKTAQLPILALTAHADPEQATQILAAGADGLLTKPVANGEVLCQAVLRAYHKPAPQQPPARPAPAAPSSQIDTAQFANLLEMAGPKGAAQILMHFHSDLSRIETALLAASHGPNWAALRTQTHILVALAGTAGATGLSQQAQALNTLAHDLQPDRGTFLTLLPQLLESLHDLLQFIATKLQEQEGK